MTGTKYGIGAVQETEMKEETAVVSGTGTKEETVRERRTKALSGNGMSVRIKVVSKNVTGSGERKQRKIKNSL